ncbi:MAG: response regulator [Chlamydiota bacterium]
MIKKRILIVDDEKDICELVKRNLEYLGDFKVDMATDGEQGLRIAKEVKPDLILLDIVMPGISGYTVLERLKDDRNTMEIPVVMLSALGDMEFKLKAAQLDDEGYITKPFDPSALAALIEEVIQRRSSR